ncbi:MAG: RNA polymerase sigma factor [Opitutales bacterium]
MDPSQWMALHHQRLLRHAQQKTGCPEIAADLVQTVYLSALRSSGRFEHRCSERTWLFQILRHKITDFYRRQGRFISMTGFAESMERDEDDIFCNEPGWDTMEMTVKSCWQAQQHTSLSCSEIMRTFLGCLQRFPTRTQQIMKARILEGMETPQLCEEFTISRENLWTILSRTRSRIRVCMGHKGIDLTNSAGEG